MNSTDVLGDATLCRDVKKRHTGYKGYFYDTTVNYLAGEPIYKCKKKKIIVILILAGMNNMGDHYAF